MSEEKLRALQAALALKQKELDLITAIEQLSAKDLETIYQVDRIRDRAANLGRRICDVAKGGQVLISQNTYDLVKEAVEAIPLLGQRFKGVAQNVTVYEVTRILD